MEEAKAAAYYDELTLKGSGAARFKQGLGFSSSSVTSDSAPSKTLQNTASSSAPDSFYRSFVRASIPSPDPESEKKVQIESIRSKLRKRPSPAPSTDREDGDRSRGGRDRDRDKDCTRDRDNRYREKDTDRDRYLDRDSHRDRDDYRDRDRERHKDSGRDRDGRIDEKSHRPGHWNQPTSRERERSRRRSRSRSRHRSLSHEREDDIINEGSRHESKASSRSRKESRRDKNAKVNYLQLIEGYSKMSPSERVKAKMKLQLLQTANKDKANKGTIGWERFDFNKDAPLDEEEVVEGSEDDASLVKDMGRSFRFSAVEAKREYEIKAAHDEAMFGVPAASPAEYTSSEENDVKEEKAKPTTSTIISDTVLATTKGSWRDRVCKVLE